MSDERVGVSIRSGEVWRLVRGDELVGEIVVDEADFPWVYGHFRPQPPFAEIKPLFDEELALVEEDVAERVPEWEQVYDRITSALTLVSPNGPVAEFLLHVQGDDAWFRWID
ncbi:hypothetical protein V5P93_000068 [Actinokineospora auranticolor]|uniref:Uncharacterized protein n=1 Tax=Actinokineospora auranticolor TaxID=155976 RepID=A0A2S6GSL6_9PSEU|nr:hypothetical protein [Actinokineospora auranticolor]PPK68163.1 hypothetical protein CLV40_106400 [Actinokineospora auranticolor]